MRPTRIAAVEGEQHEREIGSRGDQGAGTSTAPLRAGKGSPYEGGVREPMIIRWPGVVRPGAYADVNVIDLAALDLCAPEVRHELPGGATNRAQVFTITVAAAATNATVTITATDSDGSVAQVEFFEGTNLRAWLFTVMHNVHVNRLRAARPTDPLEDEMPELAQRAFGGEQPGTGQRGHRPGGVEEFQRRRP